MIGKQRHIRLEKERRQGDWSRRKVVQIYKDDNG